MPFYVFYAFPFCGCFVTPEVPTFLGKVLLEAGVPREPYGGELRTLLTGILLSYVCLKTMHLKYVRPPA